LGEKKKKKTAITQGRKKLRLFAHTLGEKEIKEKTTFLYVAKGGREDTSVRLQPKKGRSSSNGEGGAQKKTKGIKEKKKSAL